MNELVKGNLKVKEVGYFYHGKRYYKFECYKQRKKNGYWYKTLITPKSGRSIEEMMKEFEEMMKEFEEMMMKEFEERNKR